MRSIKPAVIGIHEILIVPEGIPHVGNSVFRGLGGFVRIIGKVRKKVNGKRNNYEKQHAPEQGRKRIAVKNADACALLLRAILHGLAVFMIARDQRAEEQHRKAASRIDADPLACRADAKEQTGQRKRPQRFFEPVHEKIHRDILVHEIVHQQNEKHRVYINGGNAGLCKVHEIKGKQSRQHKGIFRFPEHALSKCVQHRQHGNANQRTDDAPAEGIHAKDRNAQRNEELSQRRVGVFIGLEPVQMLIGSTRMVQLVKVHAVVAGGRIRNGILLVQKTGLRALGIQDAGGNQASLIVKEGDLVEFQPAGIQLQLHRRGCKVRRKALPAEHVVIALLIGHLSVARPQQHCPAVVDGGIANVAVDPVFGNGNRLVKGNGYRFAKLLRFPVGLGRLCRAKMEQGNRAVNQHKKQQKNAILSGIAQLCVRRNGRKNGARRVAVALGLLFLLQLEGQRRPVLQKDAETDVAKVQKAQNLRRRTDAHQRIIQCAARALMIHDVHGCHSVEQQRSRKPAKADQQSPITLIYIGHKQQQQHREQIALVHIVTKGKDHRKHECAAQVQRARMPAAAVAIGIDREHDGKHDKDRAPDVVG